MAESDEQKKKKVKESLRLQGLKRREGQPPGEIKRKSRLIKEKLFGLSEYKKAETIMFYMAKSGEVETEGMIQESLEDKKRVVVPKVKGEELVASELLDIGRDLQKGAFGIKEPNDDAVRQVPLNEIDLVILPGVAFDLKRNRLGYGRGYFDRFLEKLSRKTQKVGIAFELQIVKRIPSLKHDQVLDKVVTEERIIEKRIVEGEE